MTCPKCRSSNVQRLRGYWEDLPAESPNRRRFAPPDEPGVQPVVALLAVIVGIAATVSGEVLAGLGITVAGLVWAAVLQRQVTAYRLSLAEYDASVICLAEYYVFA
ncbi:hypothetical protein [Streptomyces apricus]|uniref:Uncharacterized protein n=1 Tax=Streptomyces apricus TaxID=1828112 RepID=A0A5B0ARN3_9ACTN|nr:hypothetical protein [Streptomyces apricus]KAA0931976.1 hypothetical protein FGF04_24310 [Streptomyces apricus]